MKANQILVKRGTEAYAPYVDDDYIIWFNTEKVASIYAETFGYDVPIVKRVLNQDVYIDDVDIPYSDEITEPSFVIRKAKGKKFLGTLFPNSSDYIDMEFDQETRDRLNSIISNIVQRDLRNGIVNNDILDNQPELEDYTDDQIESIIQPYIDNGSVYIYKDPESYMRVVHSKGLISKMEHDLGINIRETIADIKNGLRRYPAVFRDTEFLIDQQTGRFIIPLVPRDY